MWDFGRIEKVISYLTLITLNFADMAPNQCLNTLLTALQNNWLLFIVVKLEEYELCRDDFPSADGLTSVHDQSQSVLTIYDLNCEPVEVSIASLDSTRGYFDRV